MSEREILEIATNELKQSLTPEEFAALAVGDVVTFMPGGVRSDYKIAKISDDGDVYISAIETHEMGDLKVLDQNGKVIRDYGRTDMVADNERPADYGV